MTLTNNNKKFYFEIHKYKDNLFYFYLKDEEGNIYLESDLYVRKTSCQEELKSVIRNFKNEDRFRVIQTFDKKWISLLRDESGEIIVESPSFETKEEAISLIKNLKNLSLKTPVIDNTKIKN